MNVIGREGGRSKRRVLGEDVDEITKGRSSEPGQLLLVNPVIMGESP